MPSGSAHPGRAGGTAGPANGQSCDDCPVMTVPTTAPTAALPSEPANGELGAGRKAFPSPKPLLRLFQGVGFLWSVCSVHLTQSVVYTSSKCLVHW